MIKLKKLSCFILLSLFLNSSIKSADVDTKSDSNKNPKKSSFLGGNISKVAGLGALIAAGTAAAYSKGAPFYPNSYAGDGTALQWNAGLENAGPENGPYAGLENGPYAGLENGPYAGLENGPENAPPENGPYAGLENGPYAGLENGPENAPSYMQQAAQQAANFAGQQWNNLTGFFLQ